MSLGRIGLVARHTFGELADHRLVFVVAAYGLALFLVSRLVGPLSAGEEVKIVKDAGLATLELAGAILAVLGGAGTVPRGSDRGTVLLLLSKPLPRWELIAGEFLGVAGMVAGTTAAMGVALVGVLASMGGTSAGPAGPVPAADPRLAIAVLLIAAEVVVLAAVALFFSVFASSGMLAVTFSAGVFVVGQLSDDLRGFAGSVDAAPWIETTVSAIGWLVPAFSSFDVKADVVHGIVPSAAFVAATCAYAALYGTALVAGAAALFSRREFP